MIANDQIAKDEIEELSSEIKIISKFSHPSLLNFIGFSLNGFKNDRKPVIVTELVTNGTLEQILQLEKSNHKIYGWDNTKKLINIFGIASGMSYMHSLGIIHCCLDPSNIYLNDMLLPKIGEYSLLTRFINNNNMTNQSMTGEKGTSIYSAPEIIAANQFSKSSDVYSFALVVYEILTNEKAFH